MREGRWETGICIFLAAMIAACIIQTIQIKDLGRSVGELRESTRILREQEQVLLEIQERNRAPEYAGGV